MIPAANSPQTQKNSLSKNGRRTVFGLDLHSWEQLMLASLAVAALAAVAGVWTTGSVVLLTRAESEASKRELEAYKVATELRIADAQARQKEAELQLEQLRQQAGPRKLNKEIFLKALEGKPKAHVEVLFSGAASDSFSLGMEMVETLISADWSAVGPIPLDVVAPFLMHPELKGLNFGPTFGVAPSYGIAINANNVSTQGSSQEALVFAIALAVGVSTSGGFDSSIPDGTVRVFIMAKPDSVAIPRPRTGPKN